MDDDLIDIIIEQEHIINKSINIIDNTITLLKESHEEFKKECDKMRIPKKTPEQEKYDNEQRYMNYCLRKKKNDIVIYK